MGHRGISALLLAGNNWSSHGGPSTTRPPREVTPRYGTHPSHSRPKPKLSPVRSSRPTTRSPPVSHRFSARPTSSMPSRMDTLLGPHTGRSACAQAAISIHRAARAGCCCAKDRSSFRQRGSLMPTFSEPLMKDIGRVSVSGHWVPMFLHTTSECPVCPAPGPATATGFGWSYVGRDTSHPRRSCCSSSGELLLSEAAVR